MTDQRDLLGGDDGPEWVTAPAVQPLCDAIGGTYRYEAFKKFHRENPQVFELFIMFSRKARESNRRYFGARMIGERIRWYTTVETNDVEYKVNDHHWPYYARLAMLMYPKELGGFFQRRDERFDVDDDTLRRDLM